MVIQESEIKEIKTIGTLNGQDVKVIITKGGFCAGLGLKRPNSQPEALAAAAHPGIVKYQIEKAYGSAFKAALCKSESQQSYDVEDKTHTLPEMVKKAGFELYVLSKSNEVDFIISKNGISIAKYETYLADNQLVISKYEFKDFISPNRFVSDVLGKTIADKAKQLGATSITNDQSS